MSTLSGLKILVTRPQPQAEAFINLLAREKASVIHCPTMNIIAFEVLASEGLVSGEPMSKECQRIKQAVMALDGCDIVICISINAARYALEWIENYWPQLPVGIAWHAVGRSTAKVLENNDITVHYPAQAMDSGGLLKLPSLQNVKGKKVLLFKGLGGRELIKQELQARGAIVETCDLYQRVVANENKAALISVLERGDISIATSHSSEMVENALSMASDSVEAKQYLQTTPLVVPGARVAEKAITLGFSNVLIAVDATAESMCSAIQNWQSNLA